MSVSSGLSETTRLAVGWLLLGGFGLVLLVSSLSVVSLPPAAFALVGIGLFGGTYLIGTAREERTF